MSPRTYRVRRKQVPEATARKYPCGCLVRTIEPEINIRACIRHHRALASFERTYGQARMFIEDELGPNYVLVPPPRRWKKD